LFPSNLCTYIRATLLTSLLPDFPILSAPPQVLLNAFGERESQVAKIQQMSLYPDEKLLWGSALLKGGDQKNGGAAAMTNDDEDDDDDRDASSASSSSSSSGGAVPMGGSFKGDRPLALPKLNLQFLSFHDYLLRAFQVVMTHF
jgi:hypothetical protein